jgi:hypothetical protein
MRNLRWSYVVFACLCFMVGCGKTHVVYVTPSPALTQVLKEGDTLEWQATEPGEADFVVHFLDGTNPCVFPGNPNPKPTFIKSENGVARCKVDKSIESQEFSYGIDHIVPNPDPSKAFAPPNQCGGCSMSAPAAGPKSCKGCLTPFSSSKMLVTPNQSDPNGKIYITCDPNANPTITAPPPVDPGDTIFWGPKIYNSYMDNWTVTYPYVDPGQPAPASLCTNGLTQFDSSHTSCQLKTGQLQKSVFSVKTDTCSLQTFTLQAAEAKQ